MKVAIRAPRIALCGAGGMLGGDLAAYFATCFGAENVIPLSRKQLDLLDPRSIRDTFQSIRPDWVVNAAAYTQVDDAEREHELALQLNGLAVEWLAKEAAQINARLLHFSTDQVFDGTKEEPYTEFDEPNPLNAYAKSKLHGERAALAIPSNLVLRVQWLYGKSKERFSRVREAESFSPFLDQRGAPTWTGRIAEWSYRLIKGDFSGLYHATYDDHATWAEVFSYVKEMWNLDVRLEPKKTAELNLPATRPLFSVLSNQKLRFALSSSSLGSWKTDLRHFLFER